MWKVRVACALADVWVVNIPWCTGLVGRKRGVMLLSLPLRLLYNSG